jgi:predicted phage tail component-like protein
VAVMADGFTYRGQHCSVFGVNLLTYRINSPDLREYEDEADGRPGALDYGTEYGKRAIDIKIDIVPTDSAFKLRQSQIYNWLKPTLPAGILIFDEIPDRLYYAKLSSKLGPEQFNRYGTLEFTMKCTDPFAYGPESIYETIIDLSPEIMIIEANGTEPTPPLIELTNNGLNTINGFTLKNEYQIE